jgi:hypothetical protein
MQNDTKEPCLACGKKKIRVIKRGLCSACYNYLLKNESINLFPIVKDRLVKKNRFLEKYPPELLTDIERLKTDANLTLKDIANKYGVSTQRVRQMFGLVAGYNYTVSRRHKSKLERIKKELEKRDPRLKASRFNGENQKKGAVSEAAVLKRCLDLGYVATPYPGTSVDLVINGFKVEVKSCHAAMVTNKKSRVPYYRFRVLKSQLAADFIVCHIPEQNKIFVIPICEVLRPGFIYILKDRSSVRRTKNRYQKYLEAWEQLENKPLRFEASHEQAI